METTPNYNLKKPASNDYYNIQDHNDNMDIIDAELKKLDQKEVPVTSVNGKTGDVVLTAADVGAETPEGAQEKADAALNSAKQYTDQEVGEVAQELAAHKADNATLNQLGHVNHAVLTATLDTSWSGASAPYTKTITVNGILSTDVPFIDIVMSGTYATDTARQEAWGYIYRAVTANNAITFYATDKPTVSLPLQIKVVR